MVLSSGETHLLASSEAPSGSVSSVITVVSHTFSTSCCCVCVRVTLENAKCLSQSSGPSLFQS